MDHIEHKKLLSDKRAVIVYGPPGSGKSTYAEKLMRLFGCESVVDEFEDCDDLSLGVLHLQTTDEEDCELDWIGAVDVYHIDQALAMLRDEGEI
jgi:uridine kinase